MELLQKLNQAIHLGQKDVAEILIQKLQEVSRSPSNGSLSEAIPQEGNNREKTPDKNNHPV